jgi:hypothetical protein
VNLDDKVLANLLSAALSRGRDNLAKELTRDVEADVNDRGEAFRNAA